MTFSLCKKRFDKKPKVNFIFYDATDWTTNKYNKYTAQYLKTQGQPGNETWSGNRI